MTTETMTTERERQRLLRHVECYRIVGRDLAHDMVDQPRAEIICDIAAMGFALGADVDRVLSFFAPTNWDPPQRRALELYYDQLGIPAADSEAQTQQRWSEIVRYMSQADVQQRLKAEAQTLNEGGLEKRQRQERQAMRLQMQRAIEEKNGVIIGNHEELERRLVGLVEKHERANSEPFEGWRAMFQLDPGLVKRIGDKRYGEIEVRFSSRAVREAAMADWEAQRLLTRKSGYVLVFARYIGPQGTLTRAFRGEHLVWWGLNPSTNDIRYASRATTTNMGADSMRDIDTNTIRIVRLSDDQAARFAKEGMKGLSNMQEVCVNQS